MSSLLKILAFQFPLVFFSEALQCRFQVQVCQTTFEMNVLLFLSSNHRSITSTVLLHLENLHNSVKLGDNCGDMGYDDGGNDDLAW